MNESKHFFKEVLNCEYVPEGVVNYYNQKNGERLSINDIFSIEEIKEVLETKFDKFLQYMKIDKEVYKFIPIANDGMGGYYAFLSNKNEETIYYLDHEFPFEEATKYSNFDEFHEVILSYEEDEDEYE